MTLRYSAGDPLGAPSGYENKDIPQDFRIPSCTIEDVDLALFNLFEKELNLTVKTTSDGEHKKLPVVFSSGERWALVKNNKLLRDKGGAIILPIVTIQRTGISQTSEDLGGRGINQNSGHLVVYKRISADDPAYQNMLNKQGIPNQDNLSSATNNAEGYEVNTERREQQSNRNLNAVRSGGLLSRNLNNNIFEVITIPAPQFYTVKYSVIVWTQYLQQLNQVIEQIMAAYMPTGFRNFKITSKKGYWFVAKFDEMFKDDSNFGDMTDNERIVKASFEVTVPAYFIPGNDVPGIPASTRRFISSPRITFAMGAGSELNEQEINVLPNDKDSGIFDSQLDPTDNNFILNDPEVGYVETTENNTRNAYAMKYIKNPLKKTLTDPEYVKVVTSNPKTGETVYVDDGTMSIKIIK